MEGRPLVELPDRQVELVRLRFSASERAAYDELQRSSMAQIKVFLGPVSARSLFSMKCS